MISDTTHKGKAHAVARKCATRAFFWLFGQCRARPPVVVNAGAVACFPLVPPTAWCGEHTEGGRS